MTKGLIIGASIVGGIFVGFVAYKVVEKKCPKMLTSARKKVSNIGKKTSEIVTDAKQAFSEGFSSAQAEATA